MSINVKDIVHHIIAFYGILVIPTIQFYHIGNNNPEREQEDLQKDLEPQEQDVVVANTNIDPGKPRFAFAHL